MYTQVLAFRLQGSGYFLGVPGNQHEVILHVFRFVRVELGAGGDFVLATKRCPLQPLGVDTQVLVSLTVCDEDELVGLKRSIRTKSGIAHTHAHNLIQAILQVHMIQDD